MTVAQEHNSMFSGSIPALVTPFAADGAFDEAAYRDFVEWQIAEGSAGLVPCGTTGEAATLTAEEHFHIVAVCVDQARGRVPVLAGAGSNDTRVAIHNIAAAKAAGADAALMVPPYYNRPNQEGIFRHFEAVANSSDLPIVLYNVPGRTVTDIAVETVGRIAHALPSVIGIKDATGVIQRVSAQRAACPDGFIQLSGNDDMALAFNATGGVHFCNRKRRAASVCRVSGGLRIGGLYGCAGDPRSTVCVARFAFHGCVAGAGQICA
jgi:4-hydroxy-tetrahydrodipicolinate synthase